jgi:hypothetical protein
MPDDDDEAAARRLTALLAGLNLIAFPSLVRPAVPYESPPTADLVSWAMRFYASVLISHVRQLLRTFLAAVGAGQTPGAFVLGRCIFELGAHAVLVHEKVGKRRAAGDLPGAWENLDRALVGNSEMRGHGERTSADTEWTKPFHVNDGLRALDRFFATAGYEDPSQKMYDTLTEHAHPNQGAFSQYYRWEESPGGARVVFLPLNEGYSTPPFAEVDIAMVAALSRAAAFFEEAGDRETATALQRLLLTLTEHMKNSSSDRNE